MLFLHAGCLQDLVQVTCSLYSSNALEVTKIRRGSSFLQQAKKFKDAGIHQPFILSLLQIYVWIPAFHLVP